MERVKSDISNGSSDPVNAGESPQCSSALDPAIFGHIADTAPLIILILDPHGVIRHGNSYFEQLTGYRLEEVNGKEWCSTILTERDKDCYHNLLHFTDRYGCRRNHVSPLVTRYGGEREIEWTTEVMRDDQGMVISYLLIGQDITAFRQAESELRDSEARLKEAQRIARVGSWDLDLLTGELVWSDEIFRLFELDKNQLGTTYEAFLDAIHPDDRHTVNEAYIKHLAGRAPYEITHRLRLSDGRIKYVIERCESEFDDDGKPLRSIGTIQDISDIKQAEELIVQDREQQTSLREMLEIALKGDALTSTLTAILSELFAISWLAILPKGGVFQMDEDDQCLRMIVSQDLSPEILSLCATVPMGRCHCGRAAASHQVQYADCVDSRHENTYPGITDHGHYTVPLIADGKLLGVLVLYLQAGLHLNAQQEAFLASASNIIASFMQSYKNKEALKLTSMVYEKSSEAVMVTDADNRIISVNQAFTRITGYQFEEVRGRNPSVLKSGVHDRAFYTEMWDKLKTLGHWQGEIWDRRKDGNIYPKWATISVLRNTDNSILYHVAQFADVTEKKRNDELIWAQANLDHLTELPNRRLLSDRMRQVMSASARGGQYCALMLIDLDHFKKINDSMGHSAGDGMLIEVAERLKSCLRESDTVARFGGDEFVVVASGISNDIEEAKSRAENIAEKIRAALSEPYLVNGLERYTTASIGIFMFHGRQYEQDNLLIYADIAMYQAKSKGRNCICFYDPSVQVLLELRNELENALRGALSRRELMLHYQVQVNASGLPIGAEALLRWNHAKLGSVPPAQFIAVAEETGLIIPIGNWVITSACAQLAKWQADPYLSRLSIAVNVSGRQFLEKAFVEQVKAAVNASGIDPRGLELELTESVILDDVESSIKKMVQLKAMGVRFSLDDFGTGYSSLSYLKRLPLDLVKIDRSFVRDVTADLNDAAIVRTIVVMSQSLGFEVIAEGVETEEQHEFLQRHGCQAYQGYLFGKPIPADEFECDIRGMRHRIF